MLEASILPETKLPMPEKPRHWGCKWSSKERVAHLRTKFISLLLVGAVACGSLGLVTASALPRTTAALESPDKVPVSMQLRLPFCSTKGLLPNGSEIVSTLMLLHYWGIPADLDNVMVSLKKSPLQKQGTTLTGPDPDKAFAGDPKKKDSAGCFAPPLVQLLSQFLPPLLRTQDATGTQLEQLAKKDLADGEPVLIWATTEMQEPAAVIHWTLPDGSTCDWPKNTVCMVLVGYDETSYWLEDPSMKTGPVRWSKQLVRKRYEGIGSHCLTVSKTK